MLAASLATACMPCVSDRSSGIILNDSLHASTTVYISWDPFHHAGGVAGGQSFSWLYTSCVSCFTRGQELAFLNPRPSEGVVFSFLCLFFGGVADNPPTRSRTCHKCFADMRLVPPDTCTCAACHLCCTTCTGPVLCLPLLHLYYTCTLCYLYCIGLYCNKAVLYYLYMCSVSCVASGRLCLEWRCHLSASACCSPCSSLTL
jgi:hypothetical protein